MRQDTTAPTTLDTPNETPRPSTTWPLGTTFSTRRLIPTLAAITATPTNMGVRLSCSA